MRLHSYVIMIACIHNYTVWVYVMNYNQTDNLQNPALFFID